MGNDSTPPDTGGVTTVAQYLPWPLIILSIGIILASLVMIVLKMREINERLDDGEDVTRLPVLRPTALAAFGTYLLLESIWRMGDLGWWSIAFMVVLVLLSFVPDPGLGAFLFGSKRRRQQNRRSRRDDYRSSRHPRGDDDYDNRDGHNGHSSHDRHEAEADPRSVERPRDAGGSGRGGRSRGGNRNQGGDSRRRQGHTPSPVEDTRRVSPDFETNTGHAQVVRDGREPGRRVQQPEGRLPYWEEPSPYGYGDETGIRPGSLD